CGEQLTCHVLSENTMSVAAVVLARSAAGSSCTRAHLESRIETLRVPCWHNPGHGYTDRENARPGRHLKRRPRSFLSLLGYSARRLERRVTGMAYRPLIAWCCATERSDALTEAADEVRWLDVGDLREVDGCDAVVVDQARLSVEPAAALASLRVPALVVAPGVDPRLLDALRDDDDVVLQSSDMALLAFRIQRLGRSVSGQRDNLTGLLV